MISLVASAGAGEGGGDGTGGPSGSGGAGGGGGGSGGPCGACKFLRRKCVDGCIFAPYFSSQHGSAKFAAVHKVFGASNVSKLLLQIPPHRRWDAVFTICYEAQMRQRDSVYGCVGHILRLQQQVVNLEAQVSNLQTQLAARQQPSSPSIVMQPQMPMTTTFTVSDRPSSSNMLATVDLSSLFDPQMQSPWALEQNLVQQQQQQQQQELHQQPYVQLESGFGGAVGDTTTDSDGLQSLARDLLEQHGLVMGFQPSLLPPRTQ